MRDVLEQRAGQPGRDLATALRSLFHALKQERVIFRDPTRGTSLPAVVRLPVPIPTSRLRGLIDRADGPMAKLVVALVAIHGLGKRETPRLRLAGLDLTAWLSANSLPPPNRWIVSASRTRGPSGHGRRCGTSLGFMARDAARYRTRQRLLLAG